MTDYPYAVEMQRDMHQHGEVHCVVAEHDAEIELRDGATTFHFDRSCVEVEGPDSTHVFALEEIVSHYKPYDVFHE